VIDTDDSTVQSITALRSPAFSNSSTSLTPNVQYSTVRSSHWVPVSVSSSSINFDSEKLPAPCPSSFRTALTASCCTATCNLQAKKKILHPASCVLHPSLLISGPLRLDIASPRFLIYFFCHSPPSGKRGSILIFGENFSPPTAIKGGLNQLERREERRKVRSMGVKANAQVILLDIGRFVSPQLP